MFWKMKQKVKRWGKRILTFWKEKIVSDPFWKLDELLKEIKEFTIVSLLGEYSDKEIKELNPVVKKNIEDIISEKINGVKVLQEFSKEELFEFKKQITRITIPIYKKIGVSRFCNSAMDETELIQKICEFLIADNFYTKKALKMSEVITPYFICEIIFKILKCIKHKYFIRELKEFVLEKAYKALIKPNIPKTNSEVFTSQEKDLLLSKLNARSLYLALYLFRFSDLGLIDILNISKRKKNFSEYFEIPENHTEFLRLIQYRIMTSIKKNKKYFFEGCKKGFPVTIDDLRNAIKLVCKTNSIEFTDSKFYNFKD